MQAIQINPNTVAYETHLPLKERFVNKVVEVVKRIVADNEMRTQNHPENFRLLKKGCFYPNDYFKILSQDPLRKDWSDFLVDQGSFFHGHASFSHFKLKQQAASSTGFQGNCFILKKGITASEGLQAIREGLSLIGCGETCQIAYYEALKCELGEAKFNAIFAADSETPLTISWDSYGNPLLPLLFATESPQRFDKGQIVYFNNTDYYPCKHVNGEASGFYTICCDPTPGQETFTTLGLSSKGSKPVEINQKMADEFNAKPIGTEFMTQEVAARQLKTFPLGKIAQIQQLKDYQIDCAEFSATRGGQMLFGFEPNLDRIAQLAAEPLGSVAKLFHSWKTDNWIRKS